MLSREQIDAFGRDGFLNAGRILDDDELAELIEALDVVLARGPDGFAADEPKPVLFRDLAAGYEGNGVTRTPVWQILNIWHTSPPFARLLYHPFIVKAISQLTGFGDLQVWHDQVQYKPAGNGGSTHWHQDAPKWPAIEPKTAVSAWIPFDDADLENGCMWMVPGSYHWGDQDAYLRQQGDLMTVDKFDQVGRDFKPLTGARTRTVKAVPRPVKRGEAHFHHALTWHGSPRNRSDRPRRAIAIHYMTSEARFTGGDHAMTRFHTLKAGELMSKAGKHFPTVCRHAQPLPAPQRFNS